jgi:predicted dehydrogenase
MRKWRVVGEKGVACSRGPDLGHQSVELYTDAGVARPLPTGSWFNDGFAGSMGEFLCAIEDEREPLNSARGDLLSLELCRAALRSVETGGPVPVCADEDTEPSAGRRRSPVIDLKVEKNTNGEGTRAHAGRAAATA